MEEQMTGAHMKRKLEVALAKAYRIEVRRYGPCPRYASLLGNRGGVGAAIYLVSENQLPATGFFRLLKFGREALAVSLEAVIYNGWEIWGELFREVPGFYDRLVKRLETYGYLPG
jgi:hypothetical protein